MRAWKKNTCNRYKKIDFFFGNFPSYYLFNSMRACVPYCAPKLQAMKKWVLLDLVYSLIHPKLTKIRDRRWNSVSFSKKLFFFEFRFFDRENQNFRDKNCMPYYPDWIHSSCFLDKFDSQISSALTLIFKMLWRALGRTLTFEV